MRVETHDNDQADQGERGAEVGESGRVRQKLKHSTTRKSGDANFSNSFNQRKGIEESRSQRSMRVLLEKKTLDPLERPAIVRQSTPPTKHGKMFPSV